MPASALGYDPGVQVLATLYLAGVAAALWRADASWRLRPVLALLWPIGPAAFAATVTLLLAASLVAFPRFGAAVGAALLAWWAMG